MKFKHKEGFSLIESTVAFFLFSLILMLYLPAFYQTMQQVDKSKITSLQWQLFYELVTIQQATTLTEEEKNLMEERLLVNAHDLYHLSVIAFDTSDTACLIQFSDGSELVVELYP